MGTVEGSYSRIEPGNLNPAVYNFIQMVRFWMRDFAVLNRLIEGEENSDRMILWAIIDACDDFNNTPPLLKFRFEDLPKSILKYGVALVLMESLTFLSVRNSLAYSDGGININIDKTSQLMQLRAMMEASYDMKKKAWKVAQNISQGYDSISSEYRLLAGYYGAW